MGTTPNYNLRYPEHPDTPDVPRDMKNLADDVDAIEMSTVPPISGTGTPGNPLTLDNYLRARVGTAKVADIDSGTSGTTAVTFPNGAFTSTPWITLGMYASITGDRFPAHYSKTANGFTMVVGYLGAGASSSVWVSWHAIEVVNQDPDPDPDLLQAPLPKEGEPVARPYDSVVTCHTDRCPNADVGIEMVLTWTDENDTDRPVDRVECGACGQVVTDITELA